jgi:hypothetical protein
MSRMAYRCLAGCKAAGRMMPRQGRPGKARGPWGDHPLRLQTACHRHRRHEFGHGRPPVRPVWPLPPDSTSSPPIAIQRIGRIACDDDVAAYTAVIRLPCLCPTPRSLGQLCVSRMLCCANRSRHPEQSVAGKCPVATAAIETPPPFGDHASRTRLSFGYTRAG